MRDVYLDNSATTALCAEAKSAMTEAMEVYGNPSSLHLKGIEAEKILTQARQNVTEALGFRKPNEGELVFTSCGSEATALALFGCAHAKERREKTKIVTTDSEHPSVEKNLQRLEKEGFTVVRVSTRGGALDEEELDRVIDEKTFMVTMMMVNNETGARYDVEKAFALAKERSRGVITHCDAVQGFLKCRFGAPALGADLITLSAHKIHGPKGVGALWIAKDILTTRKIVPFLDGGGQENGLRSGTENVIGIAGFGAAAAVGKAHFADDTEKMRALRDYACERMPSLGIRVNLPSGARAPHIVNITLPAIKSETMLHFLSSRGIYISSGSACSSHARHASASLLGFGLSAFEADYSMRVSLCRENTEEDIDALCAALAEGVQNLIRIRK